MEHAYKTVKITAIEKESDRVKTFTLDTAVEARPGQYVMVWLPRMNEKPFGVLTKKPLRLSIARVGPATEIIHTLKKGDRISFRGPYGKSFRLQGKRPLFVAGGYGVVPLYFFATELPKAVRSKTTVVIGAKQKSELSLIGKFKKLGVKISITTDDGSMGRKGFSTDAAGDLMKKGSVDSLYACGPEIMMQKVAVMADELHIPSQVSIERSFKCGGMGLCGACSFHGKLVCVDGPVFPGSILLK